MNQIIATGPQRNGSVPGITVLMFLMTIWTSIQAPAQNARATRADTSSPAATLSSFVEEIGFRSTKLGLLDEHLVSIPNDELVSKNIENGGKHIRRIANQRRSKGDWQRNRGV